MSGNVRLDLVFFVQPADQGFIRFEMPSASPCAIQGEQPPDIDADGLMFSSDLETDQAGNVYVGWIDDDNVANDEIMVTFVGSASSLTTGTPRAIVDASAQASTLSISARGPTRANAQVALVWRKSVANERIGIAWSLDGGATWAVSELTDGASNLVDPSIEWVGPGSDAVVVYTRLGTPNLAIARRVRLETAVTTLASTIVSGTGSDPTGPMHVSGAGGLPTVATWERSDGASVNVFAVTSTSLGTTWSAPQLVFSNAGTTSATPRAGVGSAWIAWTRDQESDGKADVWLSVDPTIGPTATRLDGLDASWRGGAVETTWTLTPHSGVLSMQLLFVDGIAVGAPIAPDPLVDRYAVLDESPAHDPAYLLRLELDGGGIETHGPVRPGARPSVGRTGCGTAGPGASPLALLLPAAACLALAVRRSAVHFRRRK